jgi:N utilization substance protein B
LYGWQLTGQEPDRIAAHFLAYQDLAKADPDYFQELVVQIPMNVKEIDAALVTFLDRPVMQVDPVECTILRIGGYELMHHTDITHQIIINEAVELAKIFGAEQGHRFINGVLDKLARAVRPVAFTIK